MTARDPSRFILLNTSHPGNVGATARAMKVMGFADLVLVAPRFPDVLEQADTLAMASGATDVLEGARIVATLAEALDGVTYLCATAMTPRDFGPPTHAPRELFASLAASSHKVGFLFGSERFGMSNEDVYRCHACLSIPTHPDYGCRSAHERAGGRRRRGGARRVGSLARGLGREWLSRPHGTQEAHAAVESTHQSSSVDARGSAHPPRHRPNDKEEFVARVKPRVKPGVGLRANARPRVAPGLRKPSQRLPGPDAKLSSPLQ